MSFSSPEDLLNQVGWPAQFLNRRGALSWSSVLSEDTVDPRNTQIASAAVLVQDALVTLRYRTATLGGKVTPEFEAKWDIANGGSPSLVSCKEQGVESALSGQQALSAFQRRVLLMATPPSFEPMAPRKAPGLTAAQPRVGA
jgi:hypothetical protein